MGYLLAQHFWECSTEPIDFLTLVFDFANLKSSYLFHEFSNPFPSSPLLTSNSHFQFSIYSSLIHFSFATTASLSLANL